MRKLENYIKENFAGMLVFGDVHGDYDSFMRAYGFAKDKNLFFMSLGDLVDRQRKPFETVMAMASIVASKNGGFTIGNHDDKFCRYANGAKVSLSVDNRRTLDDVGPEREAEFLEAYVTMAGTETFSGLYHQFDNITIVHAASHPAMWEESSVMSKSQRSRYIVGETNGEKYDDGYPVRLYSWIDDIPAGKTVIVGHDKQPIHNIPITEPMVVNNAAGGQVVFLDTGGGKNGFLSGAVIMPVESEFKIISFVDFK